MNPMLFLAFEGTGETSIQIGYYAAAFGVAITLGMVFLNWRQRDWSWAMLYLPLLLLHPSWTIGIGRSDGGYAMRFLSVAATITLVAILICAIFWPHFSKRRFLLSICLIVWTLYLTNWPLDRLLSHFSQMPDSDGGFWAQAVVSFIMAGNDLLLIALGLTLICFMYGIFASKRNCSSRMGLEPHESPQGYSDDNSRSKLGFRILSITGAICLLLCLILLGFSFVTFGPNPAFTVATLIWSVILVISAFRGRFPGWS
jgi:hypothetical protein